MTDSGWRKRQIALDAKAENARELGLDYEPDKTVIGMAREAGDATTDSRGRETFVFDCYGLEAFAKLVREDEREACAKMFDEVMPLVTFAQNDQGGCLTCGFTPKLAAAAIRARGQPTCAHEWIDATTTKPQWHCAKCGKEYTKEQP